MLCGKEFHIRSMQSLHLQSVTRPLHTHFLAIVTYNYRIVLRRTQLRNLEMHLSCKKGKWFIAFFTLGCHERKTMFEKLKQL